MKKLLMAFVTAALLMVCLCVPAFATDECAHDSGNLRVYINKFPDGSNMCSAYVVCLDCGIRVIDTEGSFDDFAPVLESVSQSGGTAVFSDGFVCHSFCEHMSSFDSDPLIAFVSDGEHYLYCQECAIYSVVDFMFWELVPLHSDSVCAGCSFHNMYRGIRFEEPCSDVLPSITTLVTSSIDWISAFALCIISNPLFLIFVCCIFVGLGIGLIKRIIRL